ncbi:adenosylcobyric acid synthase [Bradyrhizobium sp. i1.3.6]
MARALMIQGAGSDVGKSLIVAGLARAFTRRGLRVLPFKPQNMSNNAAVTVDGGEIGRAQALQALAAGVEPHTDMNPVLLKPETDVGAQVIVQGKRIAAARAREYAAMKPSLMGAVLESFERLKARADLVLVEGAGSPAEVNLRKADIANMGFARKADVPVVLVGDIDRGGVIAQLVGIKTVIDPDDAAMIEGFFVINKFRGDPSLFDDGYKLIEQKTAWRGLGVLPWFARAGELPAEDALGLSDARKPGQCKIACLALSRIANFDDLDPLKLEPGVDLVMVRPGEAIPGDVRLVIIPGSKSTRGDLAFLRAQGWDIDLLAHHRRGGHVLGLCGGYQMLGRSVADPDGIEGPAGDTPGLGLPGRRHNDEPAEDADARRGRACRHGPADRRLRNPHRPHRRTGSRAPVCETEWGAGGRDLARWPRAGQLFARPVHVGRFPQGVSRKARHSGRRRALSQQG